MPLPLSVALTALYWSLWFCYVCSAVCHQFKLLHHSILEETEIIYYSDPRDTEGPRAEKFGIDNSAIEMKEAASGCCFVLWQALQPTAFGALGNLEMSLYPGLGKGTDMAKRLSTAGFQAGVQCPSTVCEQQPLNLHNITLQQQSWKKSQPYATGNQNRYMASGCIVRKFQKYFKLKIWGEKTSGMLEVKWGNPHTHAIWALQGRKCDL